MTIVEDENRRRQPIQQRLLAYLNRNVGQTLPVHQIAADLNEDVRRIGASLAHIVSRNPEWGIQRAGKGVYVYRPTKQSPGARGAKAVPASGELCTVVGVTKDGTLVIQAEDGTLYQAAIL